MKNETRNEIYRNEMKRNEIYQNEMKHNEIYRNETKCNVTKFTETERNETKWNVHKNWKGMQFRETNIPKWNKTEYVETYLPVPSPIWMTFGHINGCSCRRSSGWFFLSMFMWLSVNTAWLFSFQFQYKKTRIIMPRAYCKKLLCVCI
jgi:hypothetical protein